MGKKYKSCVTKSQTLVCFLNSIKYFYYIKNWNLLRISVRKNKKKRSKLRKNPIKNKIKLCIILSWIRIHSNAFFYWKITTRKKISHFNQKI